MTYYINIFHSNCPDGQASLLVRLHDQSSRDDQVLNIGYPAPSAIKIEELVAKIKGAVPEGKNFQLSFLYIFPQIRGLNADQVISKFKEEFGDRIIIVNADHHQHAKLSVETVGVKNLYSANAAGVGIALNDTSPVARIAIGEKNIAILELADFCDLMVGQRAEIQMSHSELSEFYSKSREAANLIAKDIGIEAVGEKDKEVMRRYGIKEENMLLFAVASKVHTALGKGISDQIKKLCQDKFCHVDEMFGKAADVTKGLLDIVSRQQPLTETLDKISTLLDDTIYLTKEQTSKIFLDQRIAESMKDNQKLPLVLGNQDRTSALFDIMAVSRVQQDGADYLILLKDCLSEAKDLDTLSKLTVEEFTASLAKDGKIAFSGRGNSKKDVTDAFNAIFTSGPEGTLGGGFGGYPCCGGMISADKINFKELLLVVKDEVRTRPNLGKTPSSSLCRPISAACGSRQGDACVVQ